MATLYRATSGRRTFAFGRASAKEVLGPVDNVAIGINLPSNWSIVADHALRPLFGYEVTRCAGAEVGDHIGEINILYEDQPKVRQSSLRL